ncbi:2-oxo-4-hydroxy-4-carboxy-5-ureidoimidazoline decarboxylase [Streptomyces sp. G5(2025)]|uniref:2-oxo-4-hydroxy-4-carboxy-5-ureidoimidazoline decarboxylase n=1 Tax=Streptomyces sp. G5(2025) TaxID=3406628 RepID=UPI003C2A7052
MTPRYDGPPAGIRPHHGAKLSRPDEIRSSIGRPLARLATVTSHPTPTPPVPPAPLPPPAPPAPSSPTCSRPSQPPPAQERPLSPHRSSRLPGAGAPAAAPVVTPEQLNSATPHAAEAALLTCCGSLSWARRVAAHRPYPDLDALLAACDEAAYDLSPADLAEALAHEPLDPPVSRPEAPQVTYGAAHTALRAAHAAYESRFGHTFVICLDEVAPDEALDQLLSALRSRLGNDPEEERAIAADELRRLARGRLTRLTLRHAAEDSADAAAGRIRPAARPDSPYVPV